MEIEIIEVIWKQSKIYIPFNNKESIVYSKNGLVFGYKSKETLTLALSNAKEIVDNGVSFDFDNTNLLNPIDYNDLLNKWNFLADISSIYKMYFEGNEPKFDSTYSYLFCCYTSKEPLSTLLRVPKFVLTDLKLVFKRIHRVLKRIQII